MSCELHFQAKTFIISLSLVAFAPKWLNLAAGKKGRPTIVVLGLTFLERQQRSRNSESFTSMQGGI